MVKGELNLIQKIFTREVVGRVTGKRLSAKNGGKGPITLYTVTQCGELYYFASHGHLSLPTIGDEVRVCIEKTGKVVNREVPYRKGSFYGNVETG